MSRYDKTYFDHKSKLGYTGDATKFAKRFRKPKKAKQWLEEQEAYELHKPSRKKGIPGNKTIASCVDAQWQADLADMQNIAKHNDGYRYLLTVIDVLSRYAWAVPIKSKRGDEVIRALKKIITTSGRYPKYYLQTDQGTEFFNPHMRELAKNNGFEHFHSQSEHKAALVERFNRTIKTYLYRYFSYKQTYRYLDVLPYFVDAYNRRVHSAHGKAPIKVTQKNQHEVFQTLYPQLSQADHDKAKREDKQFKVGDHVRISKVKRTFEKGYLPNWTTEVFVINDIQYKYPRTTYYLKDLEGEDIEGGFYSEHLQKAKLPEFNLVEEIIKSRKPKGREKEYLVKWKGYGEKFNSWVKESEVADVTSLRGK